MALRKFANKRDRNEREIIRTLIAAGATVYQLDQPCDLLVGYHGINKLIEVKDKGGSLTDDQVKFRAEWEGQYTVVWTSDDALRELGAML